MIPGLNFTALDFENANNYQRSACSLGVVRVRDGEIAETKYWLIKPDPLEVGMYQQKVHKLSLNMLRNQPTFGELWAEIHPYLHEEILVAHNTDFDIGVLDRLLDHYGLDLTIQYSFCTHKASAACWPEQPRHRLSNLATWLGIELDHHHAASDALASAQIAIALAEHQKVNDFAQLKIDTSSWGVPINHTKPLPNSGLEPYLQNKRQTQEVNLDGIPWSTIDPAGWSWKGKYVHLTGEFDNYPERKELANELRELGAKVMSSVNKRLDVAVIGAYPGLGKIQKLLELAEQRPLYLLHEAHYMDVRRLSDHLVAAQS
ncbi:DNA polymerase-3 subunit epsilon [Rhabdobacter roseus]|uniref:DNA polymerase-3 subunit epsilon n=1 Tax=Rhabdobacter roseus TaxID=1655419 RepID=A0A840TSX7_9BACT|nr:DNA polymerase-3 subunit epsilon [Rhabdobacter roseus]